LAHFLYVRFWGIKFMWWILAEWLFMIPLIGTLIGRLWDWYAKR